MTLMNESVRKRRTRLTWKPDEEARYAACNPHIDCNWHYVSAKVGTRDPTQCKGHYGVYKSRQQALEQHAPAVSAQQSAATQQTAAAQHSLVAQLSPAADEAPVTTQSSISTQQTLSATTQIAFAPHNQTTSQASHPLTSELMQASRGVLSNQLLLYTDETARAQLDAFAQQHVAPADSASPSLSMAIATATIDAQCNVTEQTTSSYVSVVSRKRRTRLTWKPDEEARYAACNPHIDCNWHYVSAKVGTRDPTQCKGHYGVYKKRRQALEQQQLHAPVVPLQVQASRSTSAFLQATRDAAANVNAALVSASMDSVVRCDGIAQHAAVGDELIPSPLVD